MSLVKLSTHIDLIKTTQTKDRQGFPTTHDEIVASQQAYFEPKNSTEKWSNLAVFAEANAIFRFRYIPGVAVTANMVIVSDTGRYRIISTEDVRGRHMYWECICQKSAPSKA
jgi:head-tail adaptor